MAMEHPNMKWKLIKNEIEREIISENWIGNSKIPYIEELATKYDTSVTTVKRALNALKEEKILYSAQGIGYYVVPFKTEELKKKHIKNLDSLILEIKRATNILGISKHELMQMLENKI